MVQTNISSKEEYGSEKEQSFNNLVVIEKKFNNFEGRSILLRKQLWAYSSTGFRFGSKIRIVKPVQLIYENKLQNATQIADHLIKNIDIGLGNQKKILTDAEEKFERVKYKLDEELKEKVQKDFVSIFSNCLALVGKIKSKSSVEDMKSNIKNAEQDYFNFRNEIENFIEDLGTYLKFYKKVQIEYEGKHQSVKKWVDQISTDFDLVINDYGKNLNDVKRDNANAEVASTVNSFLDRINKDRDENDFKDFNNLSQEVFNYLANKNVYESLFPFLGSSSRIKMSNLHKGNIFNFISNRRNIFDPFLNRFRLLNPDLTRDRNDVRIVQIRMSFDLLKTKLSDYVLDYYKYLFMRLGNDVRVFISMFEEKRLLPLDFSEGIVSIDNEYKKIRKKMERDPRILW